MAHGLRVARGLACASVGQKVKMSLSLGPQRPCGRLVGWRGMMICLDSHIGFSMLTRLNWCGCQATLECGFSFPLKTLIKLYLPFLHIFFHSSLIVKFIIIDFTMFQYYLRNCKNFSINCKELFLCGVQGSFLSTIIEGIFGFFNSDWVGFRKLGPTLFITDFILATGVIDGLVSRKPVATRGSSSW